MNRDRRIQRPTMTHADRQRNYRERRRNGERVVSVRVTDRVIEALIISERLGEAASRDRQKLATSVADVLQEWATRWL
jgi:hypothetical protein